MNISFNLATLALATQLIGVAVGETTVVAHYKLGENAGQVTFEVGPKEQTDFSGREKDLVRQGEPKFFAAAPPHRAGSGSLQFDGNRDMYTREENIVDTSDNCVIEAWAASQLPTHDGLHGVVANGNGGRGYVLGQSGDRWVAFVGGVGSFDLGPVQEGAWTHLAIVKDQDSARAFRDGALVCEIAAPAAIASQFRIGNAGLPTEGFKGLIHEVRVAKFETGCFDPMADLLVDYKAIDEAKKVNRAERTALISSLADQSGVEDVKSLRTERARQDWLIRPVSVPASVQLKLADDGQSAEIMLSNGLVSRTFYLGNNLACVSYRNLSNEAEFIRGVKPEARVKLDDTWYPIGGLSQQPESSYLMTDWLPDMPTSPTAFRFTGMSVSSPMKRYHWQPKFNAVSSAWPPKGIRLTMHYVAPQSATHPHRDVTVDVHYEIYAGLPVIAKSIEVHNNSEMPIEVDEFESEILALAQDQIERIHTESDYSCHLINHRPGDAHAAGDHSRPISYDTPAYLAGGTTTKWKIDPAYNTWAHHTAFVDHLLGHLFRNLMISQAPVGPDQIIEPGDSFFSFHTFELLQDSDEVERRSLGVRRFYRLLAPQVTEHLLAVSTPTHDPAVLIPLIDQMHEVGFERLDISFWPGIAHDNLERAYVDKWSRITSYARQRGIITGGYELMVASRGRGPSVDVVDPATGKPGSPFGQSVCIASDWSDTYYPRVWEFVDRTGFGSLNPDGPYHGCPCASTTHKHHRGLKDSQWAQWQQQVSVFHEVQQRNMWAPAPDWYFLNGQSCTGMGYREASANLSREHTLLLYRQYIYDGTFFKTPSMGWMSIGLIPTYVNDPRSVLEPLHENIEWYELHMAQLLASGAQPSFRANRLYDTPATKKVVQKWIGWFKQHRDILMSDLIHVRRPDGRDIDVMLHVNPDLSEKGMAIIFNPLNESVTREVTLPLYYTGLNQTALIRQEGQEPVEYRLDERRNVTINAQLPPRGVTWYVIE